MSLRETETIPGVPLQSPVSRVAASTPSNQRRSFAQSEISTSTSEFTITYLEAGNDIRAGSTASGKVYSPIPHTSSSKLLKGTNHESHCDSFAPDTSDIPLRTHAGHQFFTGTQAPATVESLSALNTMRDRIVNNNYYCCCGNVRNVGHPPP